MPTNFASQDADIDLDGFLSDDEPTQNQPQSAPTGNNIFNAPPDEIEDLLALPDPAKPQSAEDRQADLDAQAALKELDEDLGDEPETPRAGRPKSDKSALITTISKLVEKGVLLEFDAEEGEEPKALTDYSEKELAELIELNINHVRESTAANTPKEFFDALPEEMQAAARYINDGGTDLKGMFRALGHVEEVRALDPKSPKDQELIVRSYLQASKFGNAEDIEEQIEEYKSSGTLGKWAGKHKPLLDDMGKEQVEAQLVEQENLKKSRAKLRDSYLQNVHGVLKEAKLGGQSIDKKRQEQIWNTLTQLDHTSLGGKPTNRLNYLLEQKQFGTEPDYDTIAQVAWLLEDPDGFRKHFAQTAVNENVRATVRTLKTEQSRKVSSASTDDEATSTNSSTRPRLARPAKNIFGR